MPVVGYSSTRETYGANTYTRNLPLPVGTQPGDVLIYAAMIAGSTVTHDTTGWTVIQPTVAVGTRSFTVMAQQYTTGTTVPITFTATVGGGLTTGIVAVRGVSLDQMTKGELWTRQANGTGSTDLRTIGLGAPYTKPSIVISMHGEGGTAIETADPFVTVTGGTLVGVQDFQAGVSSNVEKVLVASSEHTGTGTSPDHVATWQNTAANNGVGISVVLPVASNEAQPTGNILHASASQFAPGALRVSARVIDPARDIAAKIESQTVTLTVDSSTGYGWADLTNLGAGPHTVTFTVDGVAQTDWTGTYKLMPTGPASYTAVAGSCQVTGSNHPVFLKMLEDDPLFLDHMGDLHYANATNEPAWRAGLNTSMETPNFRALTAGTQMHWQWDNHDRIIIDTLNLGSTDPATLSQWRKYAGTSDWPIPGVNARTWVAGRVRYIATDHWTVRDDPDLVAEPRTFMGAAQKQWFKDTLDAATEPVIVWFTQWTGQNNANGRWDSFKAESAELEAWINAHPSVKARLILIGGDSHSLQADSGTRTGIQHRFQGVPNLNMSGFNQASEDVSGTITPTWDIACSTIFNPATESQYEWGGYSRITVQDDGNTVHFRWEAVRVNTAGVQEVMATYERKVGTITVNGELCTLWGHNGTRSVPLAIEMAPAGETLPEGLAARWTFDQGLADAVAGRELELTSAGLTTARGGYALAAMNSTAKAQSPDGFLDLTGFTIAFWLYTPTTAETTRVAFLAGSTAVAELYGGWRLLAGTIYEVNRALVVTDSGSYNRIQQTTTGGGTIPAQSWRHVVATYDGAALTLYTNGVQRSTGPKTGTVSDPDTFTIDLMTGSLVDDVEIWSRALTQAEITAMYNEGL